MCSFDNYYYSADMLRTSSSLGLREEEESRKRGNKSHHVQQTARPPPLFHLHNFVNVHLLASTNIPHMYVQIYMGSIFVRYDGQISFSLPPSLSSLIFGPAHCKWGTKFWSCDLSRTEVVGVRRPRVARSGDGFECADVIDRRAVR